MVRLVGVEPTTTWFVARYSIQLSYKRTSWRRILQINNLLSMLKLSFTNVCYSIHQCLTTLNCGGERGIRTLDRISPIRP